MNLLTAPIQSGLLNSAVLLTGAPRSGTTLLGKILGSFEGFEYHFEPPCLYMIAAAYATGSIAKETARAILTVYLSEDLFLETVHGRTVNLRPSDDSQIFNRLQWSELNDRWNNIANRSDAINWIRTHNLRFVVKMPYIYDSLDLLEATCADLSTIISVRNGTHVVRSILRKGWVSRNGLERNLWPYSKVDPNTINIPYWVPDSYKERWSALTDSSRACIMWTHHAELGLKRVAERQDSDRLIQVRYEDLLNDPWPVVNGLAETLGATPTLYTRIWIDRISTPVSMQADSSRDFASNVEPEILHWFDRVNAAWGYA